MHAQRVMLLQCRTQCTAVEACIQADNDPIGRVLAHRLRDPHNKRVTIGDFALGAGPQLRAQYVAGFPTAPNIRAMAPRWNTGGSGQSKPSGSRANTARNTSATSHFVRPLR